ncbi:hypothetical protein [Candidatus Puniceispirillum marinum]|uniref:Uncharacterized protein n=1 Tax=Puniceispirillum marinum (strain IMCC1322) TaxID=488538 RepID=D5BPE9_PUNMI|nr:hypothetical protein [Candidatus Puniceispirillum marinum]ADE38431.1 hypothetical protein SAR116_0188 [Candidatus Puniceispirillum marinum IMCC1322]
MAKPIPTDDELIAELIHSFGGLWYVEHPMVDCFVEVISKEITENKIVAIIEQTILNLDDVEELFAGQDLTGSIWTFILEMRLHPEVDQWKWHWHSDPNDQSTRLSEIKDKDSALQAVFDEVDWYDCLATYEMTSAELMAKLPEKYRKFYEPHHKQFLDNGEFV